MGEVLDLCAGCSRHVRASASACPFCGHARVSSEARELAVEPLHMSRAAIVALSASLALAGCNQSATAGAGNVYGSPPIVHPYGAPPMPRTPTSEPSPSASATGPAPSAAPSPSPTGTGGGPGTPSAQ